MHRGWFYVLFGLLFSSFLGGAIHVVFSPERTREAIEEALTRSQPKFAIDFHQASLQLAGEWWPTVAVELKGIEIKARDACITNSTIQMDELLVPLDLSSIFKNKMRFGHVRAGHVRVFLRSASCQDQPAGKTKEASAAGDDEVAPFERFFQKRWSKEIVNTTRFLQELSIDSLELLRDDQGLAPATIQNLEMSFLAETAESLVHFEARLGQPWVGEAPFGRFIVDMVIRANELQVRAKGNLKEGQLRVESNWAIDRGEIETKLVTRDLPAVGVLQLLHKWDYLPSLNPNVKNQWLSCDLSLAGDIRNVRRLPLKLHDCRLYGDLGEMQVLTTQIPSLSEGTEVRVQIQDIDVKRVLESFSFGSHWGVVSQFGKFTGEMILDNRRTYELKGEVHDSEFYFKSAKQQVRQKLNSFAVALAMDGERFSGQATKFFIDDGEVNGVASFNITPAGEGVFQVALDKIVFPLLVQKAVWNGRVSEVAIFGKGEIAGSAVSQFNGRMAFKEWLTSQWDLQAIKMDMKYKNDVWAIQPSAEHFKLQPESSWASTFNTVLADLAPVSKDLQLGPIRTEIHMQDGNWQWNGFSAAVAGRNLKISSTGAWSYRDGLSGWLSARNGGAKPRVWTLTGDWARPGVKDAAEAAPSQPNE